MSFLNTILLLIVENFPANNNLLMSWQQKNVKWLQNVEVHCETTQGIKVTVMPFYMGCRVSLPVLTEILSSW